MSAVMQTIGRGRKHRCAACGAAFYDLEREMAACPKCETPYAAAAHMPRGEPARKRQSLSRAARRAEPEAAPEAPAAAADEDNIEGVPLLDAADETDDAEEGSEVTPDGEADDAEEEREAPGREQD